MTLPFVMPDPFSFQKRVFAHYFYPFPLSIDNLPAAVDYAERNYLNPQGEGGIHAAYGGWNRARSLPVLAPNPDPNWKGLNMQTEVRMAIARGITGFTFDILNLADAMSPTGHLQMLLAAAQTVDPRFWIVPMLDMSSLTGLTQAQAVTLLAGLTHPSIARLPDGRMLVSAFNATAQPLAFWQGVFTALNAQGINVDFIPVVLGSATSSVLDPVAIGTGQWGTANPAAAGPAGYMAAVLTQQFRPKDSKFWEASNTATFRADWAQAIAGGHPYVQIITWSDFSETGQVQPYTDASLAPNIGTVFYDLCAYYATWFMSGKQPVITKDTLYWCYRKMQSTAAHPNQPNAFTIQPGETEESNIELLAFLTAPGTLVINGATLDAPAGITSFKAPMAPGNPSFALRRNVISFTGPVQIYGPQGSSAGVLDLTYWGGSQP
jgi:hypothetical protein